MRFVNNQLHQILTINPRTTQKSIKKRIESTASNQGDTIVPIKATINAEKTETEARTSLSELALKTTTRTIK